MAELDWLAYTGAISGVVGAITGIAGAVMGFIGYRYSKELKSLDLRLELRKTVSDLVAEVQELPDFLDHINRSHNAVAAATGLRGSGALQKWTTTWEADVVAVKALQQELPDPSVDHADKTPPQLEAMLVTAHTLRARGSRIREKYASELEGDERARDHLRADIRVRTQSRLEGKQ